MPVEELLDRAREAVSDGSAEAFVNRNVAGLLLEIGGAITTEGQDSTSPSISDLKTAKLNLETKFKDQLAAPPADAPPAAPVATPTVDKLLNDVVFAVDTVFNESKVKGLLSSLDAKIKEEEKAKAELEPTPGMESDPSAEAKHAGNILKLKEAKTNLEEKFKKELGASPSGPPPPPPPDPDDPDPSAKPAADPDAEVKLGDGPSGGLDLKFNSFDDLQSKTLFGQMFEGLMRLTGNLFVFSPGFRHFVANVLSTAITTTAAAYYGAKAVAMGTAAVVTSPLLATNATSGVPKYFAKGAIDAAAQSTENDGTIPFILNVLSLNATGGTKDNFKNSLLWKAQYCVPMPRWFVNAVHREPPSSLKAPNEFVDKVFRLYTEQKSLGEHLDEMHQQFALNNQAKLTPEPAPQTQPKQGMMASAASLASSVWKSMPSPLKSLGLRPGGVPPPGGDPQTPALTLTASKKKRSTSSSLSEDPDPDPGISYPDISFTIVNGNKTPSDKNNPKPKS